jgi:hypothetical protein
MKPSIPFRGHQNSNARSASFCTAMILAGLLLPITGCGKKHLEISPQLKSFASQKETQEKTLVEMDAKNSPDANPRFPDCQPFFSAAAKGDWLTVSNVFSDLENRANGRAAPSEQYQRGLWLTPVMETYGAFEAFALGHQKYAELFGNEIVQSIPPGSVYFGGTDPGRFVVTAMQKSQVNDDPFFTLTQNALADGFYLKYLRSMYGDRIYVPTDQDSQNSFKDYTDDVQSRRKDNKLKPGENVKVSDDGRVQVSGQVAVMQINGLLAKIIFDKNPDRDFYIEVSFPLDWMYPYLEPHGLILKINHQPLPQLSEDTLRQDQQYWANLVAPMIGDWLKTDTSIPEITAFAEKVRRHDFSGFTGDPAFVQNDYSRKMFSAARAHIADLYVWRMNQATASDEKDRMASAADFAFRQALALCPYHQEAAKAYEDFLNSQNRNSDAGLIHGMAVRFPNRN